MRNPYLKLNRGSEVRYRYHLREVPRGNKHGQELEKQADGNHWSSLGLAGSDGMVPEKVNVMKYGNQTDSESRSVRTTFPTGLETALRVDERYRKIDCFVDYSSMEKQNLATMYKMVAVLTNDLSSLTVRDSSFFNKWNHRAAILREFREI